MKNVIPFAVLASVGFAQVAAAPYNIVVITGSTQRFPVDATTPFRLGHAAGLAPASIPAVRIKQHGCSDDNQSMTIASPAVQAAKERMLELQNRFRAALGLPLIVSGNKDVADEHTRFFPATHLASSDAMSSHGGTIPGTRRQRLAAYRARMTSLQRAHFPERLQRGLAMLGPWEGRAVAFVLGCGLGSLLRMIFMMFVLMARSIRGTNVVRETVDEEESESPLVLAIAPPAYADDEKVMDTNLIVESELSG